MKTNIFYLVLILISNITFAQLTIEPSGKVFDSNNKKLTNSEIRTFLTADAASLELFDAAQSKSTFGGFLLGFGIGSLAGDLLGGLTTDKGFPTAFTYIGAACTVISIPVLCGRTKKRKAAIESYNSYINKNQTSFLIEKITLKANANGVGIALNF